MAAAIELILVVFQNLQHKEKKSFIYDGRHQGTVGAVQTFVSPIPGRMRDQELCVFQGCVRRGREAVV